MTTTTIERPRLTLEQAQLILDQAADAVAAAEHAIFAVGDREQEEAGLRAAASWTALCDLVHSLR